MPKTIHLLPDFGKCSMDPLMDYVGLTSLDFQSIDQTIVSLAERRSSFQNSGASSSIITIDDTIPFPDWKVPEILPSEVYKIKWWQYTSHTKIKISSLDITFTDQEEPIHINLIDKEQIDWAKTKGYKYVHMGIVKLGLGPLVRPYMNVSSLCCVLDTRHLDFYDALIGGIEGPLDNGPFFGIIFPKYSANLNDPYIYDLLKAYIHPLGFKMDTGSKIIQLKSMVVIRFGNDSLPPLIPEVP